MFNDNFSNRIALASILLNFTSFPTARMFNDNFSKRIAFASILFNFTSFPKVTHWHNFIVSVPLNLTNEKEGMTIENDDMSWKTGACCSTFLV